MPLPPFPSHLTQSGKHDTSQKGGETVHCCTANYNLLRKVEARSILRSVFSVPSSTNAPTIGFQLGSLALARATASQNERARRRAEGELANDRHTKERTPLLAASFLPSVLRFELAAADAAIGEPRASGRGRERMYATGCDRVAVTQATTAAAARAATKRGSFSRARHVLLRRCMS